MNGPRPAVGRGEPVLHPHAARAWRQRRAGYAMRQGLRALTRGPAGAREALGWFESARDDRVAARAMTGDERFQLAGTWINIATACLLLQRPAKAITAECACRHALACLDGLPTSDRVARRASIAHHTRGRALQRLGRRPEAIAALTSALAGLDAAPAASLADRDVLVAASYASLADVQASSPDPFERAEAVACARRALELVRAAEASDPQAGEIGLMARHAGCRGLAPRLAERRGRPSQADDIVHQATDAADDALALAHLWAERGVTGFAALADDLYRFGAAVYARYQPQFLAEFLSDHAYARR